MPSKCNKCGNTENYNAAINNGLCDPCIEARIAELEAKVNRLSSRGIEDMQARIAELESKLEVATKSAWTEKEIK